MTNWKARIEANRAETARLQPEVDAAWQLFDGVQEELEVLQENQERLRHLLTDFGSEEWGNKNWSEDSERVLTDLRECLEALGTLAK